MMMRRTSTEHASAAVDSLGGAAAIRLDYGVGGAGKGDFCALLVLPPEAGAASLAATVLSLSSALGARRGVDAALSQLHSQKVDLRLPRLKAAFGSVSLVDALRALGVTECFGGSRGFLRMSDDETVHINDVLTKAVLEVDEEGTTAAAAAAVMMMKRSIPRPPMQLTFDRPFVMAVLHVPSGAPIFVAQINEPGA